MVKKSSGYTYNYNSQNKTILVSATRETKFKMFKTCPRCGKLHPYNFKRRLKYYE